MATQELTARDRDWLTHLQSIAVDLPKVAGVRVVAGLIEGRTLLGVGWNQYKTHPLQRRFASNPEAIYLHAEVDAIHNSLKRCREYHWFGRSCMYIVRVGAKGELRLAKPCVGCMRAIEEFEIGRVVWSKL